MSTIAPYCINGERAEGDAFRSAIEGVHLDQSDLVVIGRSDESSVLVCTHVDGGALTMIHTRVDGSEWLANVKLDTATAQERIKLFLLNDANWDQGITWESQSMTSQQLKQRLIWLAFIGVSALALAAWLLPRAMEWLNGNKLTR